MFASHLIECFSQIWPYVVPTPLLFLSSPKRSTVKHSLNTVTSLFQALKILYHCRDLFCTKSNVMLLLPVTVCAIDEPTEAPPAGAELTMQPEVGSSWFLGAMCFGLTVIVSAFVYVGAQRCRAHVEPHSHSSNTTHF